MAAENRTDEALRLETLPFCPHPPSSMLILPVSCDDSSPAVSMLHQALSSSSLSGRQVWTSVSVPRHSLVSDANRRGEEPLGCPCPFPFPLFCTSCCRHLCPCVCCAAPLLLPTSTVSSTRDDPGEPPSSPACIEHTCFLARRKGGRRKRARKSELTD